MDEQALYSVKEAAEEWGISIQAVYKRLNRFKRDGLTVEKEGVHYIPRDIIEAYREDKGPVFKPTIKPVEQLLNQEVESLTTSLKALQDKEKGLLEQLAAAIAERDELKAQLLAEQGKTSTLQATADAKQAHIDSLKQALDREQALHMASLQARLPAGRGFFSWLKGKKGDA